MVSNSTITTTLPVVDLNRAKKFYHETLGLKITMEDPMGIVFESGGCTLYLYKRDQPTRADHTVFSFEVENIESEVRDLRGKGIKFEEYDKPEMGLKTVNGVATWTGNTYADKSAWFKDTEGNIIALHSRVKVGSEPEVEIEEGVGVI